MSKFGIDYTSLKDKIEKRKYPFEDVKHKIEKVAFDIVRFRDDDPSANLWKVVDADDGKYIVALYETEEEPINKLSWSVEQSKISGNLNVFYNGDYIAKISASSLGDLASEIDTVKSYLPKKLASNKGLVSKLLNTLSSSAKAQVLSKYPELG